MLDDFIKYIEENHLFGQNDNILLGVSGGIDSMVMSHLFHEAGIPSGIAHCNFCLRAEESDRDEELVRNYAAENKIPFFSIRFDTKAYAKKQGISIQMAARELRYNWFETIRKENGFAFIAVGHNLDDNIETMLINLVRGTGIAGLTGMKPATDKIVRPLLFASRRRIAEYCGLNIISFREDQSNFETKYTRNKIRHLVIPVLKEINPSVEETLSETSLRLSGINKIVSEFINSLRDRISLSRGSEIIFRVSDLKDHLSNSAIIFELFRPYGITGPLTKDLIKLLTGRTGARLFTRTHVLLLNREELIVTKLGITGPFSFEIRDLSDLHSVPFIVSAEIADIYPDFNIPDDRYMACLDLDYIEFPMIIRSWHKGDYFYPLGMKQKKKISDYFIDRKIPLTQKEQILVLESRGNIVWVIGERIDDRFRIRGSTSRILRIEATDRLS